jgi:hypothetical protein
MTTQKIDILYTFASSLEFFFVYKSSQSIFHRQALQKPLVTSYTFHRRIFALAKEKSNQLRTLFIMDEVKKEW